MRRRWSFRWFVLASLAAVVASSGTLVQAVPPPLIVGGDLGGADLSPANGSTLSGSFTNVGTFTIAAGDTVFVDPGVPLSIQAAVINIDGTLDGNGAGSPGGASVTNIVPCVPSGTVTGLPGSGPGGGGGGKFGCNVHGSGGGGGGYGGTGGVSGSFFSSTNPGPAAPGPAFGDATSPSVSLGSGGGSGSKFNQSGVDGASGAGGAGGAAISLLGVVNLNGTILADGSDGLLPIDQNGAGGGGGAGGGVLLDGSLALNGTISAAGGDGVTEPVLLFSSGGGGGGGRVKLFGCTSGGQDLTTDVSGGGVDPSHPDSDTQATPGGAGTIFDGTTGECAEDDFHPPECRLTHFGPQFVEISVRDTESGIGEIIVLVAQNVVFDPIVFDVGTTDIVRIKGARTGGPPSILLEVVDVQGNIVLCRLHDHEFDSTSNPDIHDAVHPDHNGDPNGNGAD